MNTLIKFVFFVSFLFLIGCSTEVSTSSGAASEDVCSDCTNIIVTNNTTFPIVITGSGRAELLFPNQTVTFKYKRIDPGENAILAAQRANNSGAAIGPAIEKDFWLRGGRQDSWRVESDDFD